MILRKLRLIVVAGATLLSVASANAQIDGNPFGPLRESYGQPQQRQRYQQPPVQSQPHDYRGRGDGRDYRGRDDGWDRRPRYGYDEPAPYRPRGRFGDYCATSRGACQTRPQPVGSSCRCDIDGLIKRGIIQ